MENRSSVLFKRISKLTIFALTLAYLIPMSTATAAGVTSLTDSLSRLKTGIASDHEIKFVTPTGVAGGQQITITFGAAFSGINTGFSVINSDFATGNTGVCSSATYTEQTLAATAGGATWGIATSSAQAITLTSGSGTAGAGNCVRFRFGSNTVTGGTGTSFITNGSAGATTATVAISGNFGDTGTLFIPIITNDQVSISATVDPTITFSLSQNSIGFGSLSAVSARYATSDTLGTSTALSAHNIIAGTNASSGYNVYLSGNTLTSGSNTITAIGGSAASSTPGSAQFGLTISSYSGGTGAPASPYNIPTQFAFNASTSTQVSIASVGAPSANTTYNITYVANIPSQQAAGSYSTTLTYTATGTY